MRGRVVVVVVALGVGACTRAPVTEEVQAEPLAAAPAPPAPVDHLAPGELIEGSEKVFGLALPRDLVVERQFSEVVYAQGVLTVHPLVKYLRARLEGGQAQEDDSTALFSHVKMPARPERELSIRIGRSPRGVRVEIRDSTPPPAPDLPDETARWKNVGLTPQGRLLDPAHLD